MMHGLGWRRDRLDWRDSLYRRAVLQPGSVKIHDVDLRDSHAMPPILDQGRINSCVGMAVASNAHYLLRAQGVWTFVPSPLFIYYNARDAIGEALNDEGCEIRDAYRALAKQGVASEDEWPLKAPFVKRRPPDRIFEHGVKHIAI